MGEPDGASKDVQPQQRGLWLAVLEDKLVDPALRDRLSVTKWGLEQRLCHVTLEVAARSDGMGVDRTWNSVLVVLLHGRGESWLSTDLARAGGGTRRGLVGECDWTA